MSQVTQRGPVKPSMNITPLIDVVFLLIIFFMLVNNIVSQEAVPMIVPSLEEPKTKELGDVDRIVVSVAPAQGFNPQDRKSNPLMYDGQAEYVKIGALLQIPMTDLGRGTEVLREAVAKSPTDAEGNSVLEVLLRADAALRYAEIQPVMAMITEAGISKVNMVAFMPEE